MGDRDCASAPLEGWNRHVVREELMEFQGARCAICERDLVGAAKGPQLDHDHGCCKRGCRDCVRGLLCVRCNMGLGYFRDNSEFLLRAAEYLDRYTWAKL